MRCIGAVVLLLFGLSIFIVPSGGVISCIQCAELNNSQLEPFWEQVGGAVGCADREPTPCNIGLREHFKEYAKLAPNPNDLPNITTSYPKENKIKTARQLEKEFGWNDFGACIRIYAPLPSGRTQMFMGCLGVKGPRDPCPAKWECTSPEELRPALPSDMGVNLITCSCTTDRCDPELLYELRVDRSACDGCGEDLPLPDDDMDSAAPFPEPFKKITLFLPVILPYIIQSYGFVDRILRF